LEADARTMEHAIAVLLAADPNALVDELDKTAPMPEIPASLPVGLPSDLLRRRPDVREAERKMAEATANEGVAAHLEATGNPAIYRVHDSPDRERPWRRDTRSTRPQSCSRTSTWDATNSESPP